MVVVFSDREVVLKGMLTVHDDVLNGLVDGR